MKKIFPFIFILLTACQPTTEMVQTAIAQTVAAYTQTPEPTATAYFPGETFFTLIN